jgi:hypothetical protein
LPTRGLRRRDGANTRNVGEAVVKLLSVIVPFYNEEANVEPLHDTLNRTLERIAAGIAGNSSSPTIAAAIVRSNVSNGVPLRIPGCESTYSPATSDSSARS